jgi:branched-chain amino acid transport system substrate-binding protein
MKQIGLLRTVLAVVLFVLAPLAATASDIVIGQVAAFSGPLAPTGTHMRAGAKLCFDAVNAEGGVHGARIRLVTRDDGYKTEETVRQARDMLKESQPLAFIGFVGTGNVEAMLEQKVLSEAGIPLIAIRSGAESLVRRNDPFLFMTRASYAEEIEKITDQYATTGYTRFAVLYQDDAFGQGALLSAEQAIRKSGGITGSQGILREEHDQRRRRRQDHCCRQTAGGDPDCQYRSQRRVPQAVTRSGKLCPVRRAFGHRCGAGGAADRRRQGRGAGADAGRSRPGQSYRCPDPGIQTHFARFKPKDVTLNHTFVEGYLGAKVLAEALRRAGPNPTRKKLRDTIEAIRDYDAGGVFISFSPKRHAGSRFVDITILNRAGKLLR